MKALVWTGPEQLVINETPYPTLEPNFVILKVESVGICGSELSGYLGHNSLRRPPLIMGHEFAGTVIEVGENVSQTMINQLVTVNPLVTCKKCRFCISGHQQLCEERKIIGINFPGAFAEYVAVPANQCYKVSDKLFGGLVEPLACSLRAINQANIKVGDVGVVTGAGIIGLMAMKLMKHCGASHVIAIDTNESRLKVAASWGADILINPKKEDVLTKINELFPTGVDRVVDAVGFSQTRKQAMSILRRGGRAVFIGLHEDDTYLAGNDIVRNEIEITGTFCYSDEEFIKSVELIEDGFLSIEEENHWYDIRSLENGNEAFQEQINGNATFSKIILVP